MLARFNILLAQAILIVTFSLVFYVASRNWRNSVARAAALLLAGVVIVYGGDVLLDKAHLFATRTFLLRAQWLGIALVPAAYLHLSDALLVSVGYPSLRRRWLVALGYAAAAVFALLALVSTLVVRGRQQQGVLEQFGAGPLFSLFVVFFALATLGGLYNIERARRRSYTAGARRRLTYLGLSFLAPGLAVFPYLIIAGLGAGWAEWLILLIANLANLGITVLIVVLAYSVAFQGVLLPDRLVKQDFIRWVLVGPFVGVTILLCFNVLPLFADALGLPSESLVTFGVMIFTVLMPNLIDYLRPRLEGVLLWQDRDQLTWLRRVDRRAFTNSDLRRLLENTLGAMCGAVRSPSGFVAAPEIEGGLVKASAGPRHNLKQFLHDHNLLELLEQAEATPGRLRGVVPGPEQFTYVAPYAVLPLRGANGDFLGAVAIAVAVAELGIEARRLLGALAHQMELALENVQLQERIYTALRNITPEMASLQQLAAQPETPTPSLLRLDADVATLPEFDQLVKDALQHYWGGPKLSESPLLNLRTVRLLLENGSGNPTKALQAVLREAIENLRPTEQLHPTAQEWVLYNILNLRFLQGLRARESADKLAMSESDLYRKQRIAVEQVARQLALMEEKKGQ